MITTAITAHNGQVTSERTDEAYRFVTVAFPKYEDREAFLTSLPYDTSWERGSEITVELDLPVEEPFEFEAPAAPVAPRS